MTIIATAQHLDIFLAGGLCIVYCEKETGSEKTCKFSLREKQHQVWKNKCQKVFFLLFHYIISPHQLRQGKVIKFLRIIYVTYNMVYLRISPLPSNPGIWAFRLSGSQHLFSCWVFRSEIPFSIGIPGPQNSLVLHDLLKSKQEQSFNIYYKLFLKCYQMPAIRSIEELSL